MLLINRLGLTEGSLSWVVFFFVCFFDDIPWKLWKPTALRQHCGATRCTPFHQTSSVWHLLNFHGYCRALSPRVSTVLNACVQREIIAGPREGRNLFNRGAHGGKAISNNVLFLQQQLCLTPMASAAHNLSSHLSLHRLALCLDIHRQ